MKQTKQQIIECLNRHMAELRELRNKDSIEIASLRQANQTLKNQITADAKIFEALDNGAEALAHIARLNYVKGHR